MIRLPTRPTRTYTLFPHTTLFRTSGGSPCKGWVSPFGHPRIKACSQLPEAFRSVPRPSSPLGAKASTRCPSSLERYFHVPSQGQGRSTGSHTLPTPEHVSAKTTRTVPQPPPPSPPAPEGTRHEASAFMRNEPRHRVMFQLGQASCRERVCSTGRTR